MADTASSHPHGNPFQGFDQSVERVVGADLRLVYGLGAPLLMVVGLIVILALSPAVWLVAVILAVEIALLGVVLTGILGMLGEDDEPDEVAP